MIRLAICFLLVAFVFPWERWFIRLLMFLFDIFLYKVSNYFGLVFGFIFKVKVIQEDLLASLMVHRVLALCCLYLFRFSDERFVLNFLKVAWCSLIMLLHSSVNHGLLCFGDGFVKFIMDSSWLVFDSGISIIKHSFLWDYQFAFLKFHCESFLIVCGSESSIIEFSIIIGGWSFQLWSLKVRSMAENVPKDRSRFLIVEA